MFRADDSSAYQSAYDLMAATKSMSVSKFFEKYGDYAATEVTEIAVTLFHDDVLSKEIDHQLLNSCMKTKNHMQANMKIHLPTLVRSYYWRDVCWLGIHPRIATKIRTQIQKMNFEGIRIYRKNLPSILLPHGSRPSCPMFDRLFKIGRALKTEATTQRDLASITLLTSAMIKTFPIMDILSIALFRATTEAAIVIPGLDDPHIETMAWESYLKENTVRFVIAYIANNFPEFFR